MAERLLRFHARPPRQIPSRFLAVLEQQDGQVELQIAVTDIAGVVGYGFSFGGAHVFMDQGSGRIFATPGQRKLLEWIMLGQAGSTMKVTVTDGAKVVASRAKSRITPPQTRAYDALEIQV